MARFIDDLEDPKQLTKFLGRNHEASMLDMGIELFQNNLVSGPKTHFVNIASTALFTGMQVPERFVGRLFSKLFRTPEGVAQGESMAMVYGMMNGIMDGWKMAKVTFKSDGTLDPLTKLGSDRRAITASNLSKTFVGSKVIDPTARALGAKQLSQGGFLGHLVDGIGTLVRLPGQRMLATEDAFFKGINASAEAHARSWRQAVQEGYTGKELADRTKQLLEDTPSDILRASRDHANTVTFTRSNALSQGFAQMSRKVPIVRLVQPFVNVLSNLFSESFKRTPLVMSTQGFWNDVAAGGATRDMALSRLSVGTSLVATASYFHRSGIITGDAPTDPQLRDVWLTENRENSFVIQNDDGTKTFIPYDRFEPVGTLFHLGSKISELAESMEDDEMDEVAAAAGLAFYDFVLDKQWTGGIIDLADSLRNADTKGVRAAQSFIASMVVPNYMSQTNRMFMDNHKRQIDSILEAIQSRIPGESDKLPYKRTVWGEKEMYNNADIPTKGS
jgi:hypothetical protein